MKKKVVNIVIVFLFVAISGYNDFMSENSVGMSDLALNNIEALAGAGEFGDGHCSGCSYTSYNICRIFGDWGMCMGKAYSINL